MRKVLSKINSTSISCVNNVTGRFPFDVSAESALEGIRLGNHKSQIELVRAAYETGGKEAAAKLKKKLPAFLFSGRFSERNDDGILQHSGILVADLDELERPIPEFRAELQEDHHVLFCFLSPTGSGLKVGFKVPADSEKHKASFEAVRAYMKQKYGEDIDSSCKNLSRLCFTSYDRELWVNWKAQELEVSDFATPAVCEGDEEETVFNETVNQFGLPFYEKDNGNISSINTRFWAGLYLVENHLLFEPNEKLFYKYIEERGLWSSVTEEVLRETVAVRLLDYSRETGGVDFEKKITRNNLDTIIAHLKGQSEKKGIFGGKKRIIHCANGVLRLQANGGADFTDFSVDDYSRNQSPIAYAQEAECPRFHKELLLSSMDKEDVLLVQKWMGLALLGDNAPQKFIILDGQSLGGKSTLIRVIKSIVGSENVEQLRPQHLGERFELYRFIGKTVLIGSDVNSKFLQERNAYVIKSLVGGDPLSGEGKNSNASFALKGDKNIIISCNTRLKVHLEGDTDAWRRRILIIRYDKPPPQKPIPDFDSILVEEEGSGILNWALEGLTMALSDINATGTLSLSEKQNKRIDALLCESDSVRNFVDDCVVKSQNEDVTSDELVRAYAEYCSEMAWDPLNITIVLNQLPDLMLKRFGLNKNHSVTRDGKAKKGWKGVSLANAVHEHLDL